MHRHKVMGLNHIEPQQKTIIAINHSLATYDALLLFHAIYEEYGIFVRPLADRLFFKIPILNEFVEELGITEGNPQKAKGLLRNNEIIVVAPGGMREALRPSSERYQIKWNNRKGFAKLSIECQTPIVLAVCPRADEIYKVYDNPITKTIYRNYRIPFFLARGIGLSLLPKAVKLTHTISKPIIPPKKAKSIASFQKQVDEYHRKIISVTEKLMEQSVNQ